MIFKHLHYSGHSSIRTSGQSVILFYLKALEINTVRSGPQKVLRDFYKSCEILAFYCYFNFELQNSIW